MFRPRIIPVLLLQNGAAVKTVQFKDPKYLGDIVNTVRLFSEMQADELIVLDIDASKSGNVIDPQVIRELSSETSMPLAVGGGIRTLEHIAACIDAGAEKVILGTIAFEEPDFVVLAAKKFGSSTISVCIDVLSSENGEQILYLNGSKKSTFSFEEAIQYFERSGAGEIILQSISNDGMRNGYKTEMIETAAKSSTIPIVALGGANSLSDMRNVYVSAYASAAAGSSVFVFRGNGILINYPEKSQIQQMFNKS